MKRIIILCSIILQFGKLSGQNIPVSNTTSSVVTNIAGGITNVILPPAPYSSTSTYLNYERYYAPQYPINDATLISSTVTDANIMMDVNYTNGFGQVMQNIRKYVANNKNLITPFDNRPGANKFSYLPYPDNLNTNIRLNPFTQQYSFYLGKYPAQPGTAVMESSYFSNAATRYIFTYAPGKSNVGQKHGTRISSASNENNEVIMWEIDAAGLPQKIGYYARGILTKKIIETSDGGQIYEYYDIDGKLICKNVLAEFKNCDFIKTNESEAGAATAFRMYAPKERGPLDNHKPTSFWTEDSTQSGDTTFKPMSMAGYTYTLGGSDSTISLGGQISDGIDTLPVVGDTTGDYTTSYQPVTKDDSKADAEKDEPYIDNEKVKLSRKTVPTNHFVNQCPSYLLTYYVYDIYERLTYVLHPKAVEYLFNNGWVPTPDIIHNLCDYTTYDNLGRIVEKHQAGEVGNELIVYDNHNRVALTKKPNDSKWYWNHYDKINRIIQTGDMGGGSARITLQNYFDIGTAFTSSPLNIFHYLINEAQQGEYIDHAITSPTACTPYTFNYYDNYDYGSYFDGTTPQPLSFSYDASVFSGNILGGVTAVAAPSVASTNTIGKLTGRVAKVIKPYPLSSLNDYVTSVIYYDGFGRQVESKSVNVYGGNDIHAIQYDFVGKLLTDIFISNNPSCSTATSTKVVQHCHYSPYTQYLNYISESIDGGIERNIATYTYNNLGQTISKNIGGIENQALTYNIRGQLTGINANYAETPGSSSGSGVTFGESIKYDAGFTNNLFGGGIAGIVWKDNGNNQHAYGYTYDRANRLRQADFREYSTGGGSSMSWNNAQLDYTEGNISYDNNGNILKLKRYGPVYDAATSTIAPMLIDNLTYVYKTGDVSNQLQYVKDAVPLSTTTTVPYDFKDNNTSTTDYTYDNNGSMTTDANKKIVSMDYYYFNKPKTRKFANGHTMDFVYDAYGNKIQEIYNSGTSTDNTSYNGAVVYKNNDLYNVLHSEGYAVRSGTQFNYFFYVKDHLGNVRNVLNSVESPYVFDYDASHELGRASTENLVFSNIENVRADKPATLDKLNIKAAMLDAADPGRIIGTALVLKVTGGDRFDITAQSFYNSSDSSTGEISQDDLFNSIMGTLTGGVATANNESASLNALKGMFSVDDLKLLDALEIGDADKTIPQAFINYILYDEQFKIIPEGCGRVQIGSVPDAWQTIGTASPIVAAKGGYLSVYISTTSTNISTWFDDIHIHHYMGAVQDVNHYYPFGLTVNLSSTYAASAPSYNPIENRFLYQTKEYDKREELYLYDFHAREYDPQIGRFSSLDAWNEYPSGYIGMGDNPISLVDPTGNKTETVYKNVKDIRNPEDGQLGVDDDGHKRIFSKQTGQWGYYGNDAVVKSSPSYVNLSFNSIYYDMFYSTMMGNSNNDDNSNRFAGGIVNLKNAKEHWKNGYGHRIVVDLTKIDLSGVSVLNFRNFDGSYKKVDNAGNPYYYANLLLASTNTDAGLVLGRIKLVLDPTTNTVSAPFPDTYDFDFDTKTGGLLTAIRNGETLVGKIYHGSGVPFQIFITGSVQIPYYPPQHDVPGD